MVIRRVRDIAPAARDDPRAAAPRQVPCRARGRGGGEKAAPPPAPDPKVTERGPEPPEGDGDHPGDGGGTAGAQERAGDAGAAQGPEHGDNSVSVVTDLPAASFIVSGPAEYRGTGTFWVRKGAPPGTYRITFSPVDGLRDAAGADQGTAWRRGRSSSSASTGAAPRSSSTATSPAPSSPSTAPTAARSDLNRPGRALLDDLPPGNYTAVFKDVPGHITPAPLSRTLAARRQALVLRRVRRRATAGRGSGQGPADRAGTAREPAPAAGTASGARGAGSGARRQTPGQAAPGRTSGELDRRVQMIVKSYPPSRIEEDHDAIPYPGVIIRKSNFQQGWCQVYLVLSVSDSGEVENVAVERPRGGGTPPVRGPDQGRGGGGSRLGL